MSQTSHAETAGLQRLTRKGQATRDRIVEAAAGLMFRQGVAGTTTEQVQAAAGVSASQIFHYFGDKRALVRAVIAWTQLFGMISWELFGQFVGSFEPADALFDHAVAQMAAFVGLG